MRRHTGLLLAGLALAILAAVFLPAHVHHAPPPAPTRLESAPDRVSAPATVAHPEVGFRSRERLVEHFRKHGRDFDARDESEYLRLAQALRDRPAGGDVVEAVRADGVITRFDRGSGAFIAFGRGLVIRTFFKPNDGESYFRRQLARGRSGR